MDRNQLKEMVVKANKELPIRGLVKYSWGNVSGIDRENKIIVIKPVGIPYDELTTENVSVVDFQGAVLEGPLEPSVDLDIHRAIYEGFSEAKAIVHTHSTYATVLAQLQMNLPCFGTTHADYFAGAVPCVGRLSKEAVKEKYEWNTGVAIVDFFETNAINPIEVPAALSAFHGPFAWGTDVWDAVHKAVVLEEIAKMAVNMYSIKQQPELLPDYMLDAHYYRKHGANGAFKNDDYGAGMVTR